MEIWVQNNFFKVESKKLKKNPPKFHVHVTFFFVSIGMHRNRAGFVQIHPCSYTSIIYIP